MWVRSLDLEDPMDESMATYSSILGWGIPRKEVPGGLQTIGSEGAGHNRSDLACMHAFIYLSSLITLFRAFSTILNRNGESRPPHLVSAEGKAFRLPSKSAIGCTFFIDFQVHSFSSFLSLSHCLLSDSHKASCHSCYPSAKGKQLENERKCRGLTMEAKQHCQVMSYEKILPKSILFLTSFTPHLHP